LGGIEFEAKREKWFPKTEPGASYENAETTIFVAGRKVNASLRKGESAMNELMTVHPY
jgi:hypothetical protein